MVEAKKDEKRTIFVSIFTFMDIIYMIKKSIQKIKKGSMTSMFIQLVYWDELSICWILFDRKNDTPIPIGSKVTSVQYVEILCQKLLGFVLKILLTIYS
jgi:hypothetical protein